jgi:hypothetical protein
LELLQVEAEKGLEWSVRVDKGWKRQIFFSLFAAKRYAFLSEVQKADRVQVPECIWWSFKLNSDQYMLCLLLFRRSDTL